MANCFKSAIDLIWFDKLNSKNNVNGEISFWFQKSQSDMTIFILPLVWKDNKNTKDSKITKGIRWVL